MRRVSAAHSRTLGDVILRVLVLRVRRSVMVPRATTRLSGAGGTHLVATTAGPRAGLPVLLLHGAGQTRHAWDEAVDRLASAGFFAVAPDLRGHGESDRARDRDYSLPAFAADVVKACSRMSRPPALVGASLGGLAALLADGEQAVAGALVLVDVAPRLDARGVDRVLSFMRAHSGGFESPAEAAEAIATYLPRQTRRTGTSGLGRYLRQGPDGRWHWHWDPGLLESADPHDHLMRERLERAASNIRAPTLLVRGADSDVLSGDGVHSLLQLIPHARVVEVTDAGHMVAGDQNDRFVDAVIAFLAARMS